jgi:hypothetical protein
MQWIHIENIRPKPNVQPACLTLGFGESGFTVNRRYIAPLNPNLRPAMQRVIQAAPGYGSYQQQTDREIPIIRLVPEE